METENFEDISNSLLKIDIEDEKESAKYDSYPWAIESNPKQPQLEFVDFELYVKEKCHSKIQILDRETFHQIPRPIVIFFNHFRFKCAYLTEWLDKLFEMALIYGDRIEFIAADMYDIDIMYPGRNQLNFYSRLLKPEHENPKIYAIDEKKRICTHTDAYFPYNNLTELCEKLLNDQLFPSQPIPEDNESKLVKIAVHLNFEELVSKSTKNIFLIINLERYHQSEYEPNYDNVALALKDYNLDIVYMEAEKNYITFEYIVPYYPTIIFIPWNDKNNFIYYEESRNETSIIEFIKQAIEQPQFLLLQQQDLKSRLLRKWLDVPQDFEMDLKEMPKFLEENFKGNFKLLDRKVLNDPQRNYYYCILIFMDFPNLKCLKSHIEWLNQIYQVTEKGYSFKYFIADFRDIDVVNTKWQPQDLIKSAEGKPRIYIFDYLRHSFEYGNFDSANSLFYFTSSLESERHLYYSQVYSRENINAPVQDWTADYFQIFLKKAKKHTFITFYSSDDENVEKLNDLMENIAKDVQDLNVQAARFDVKLNYVDLEYTQDSYPVHYFISKFNKRCNTLYRDKELSRKKMLEFIKTNVEKS